MNPVLSLIIPYHNHRDSLPRLLDSIAAQSLKEIEVLIVDDCSDFPCDDIAQAYAGRGMHIRLLPSATRLYTKNARIRGMEEASAPVVGFADADDQLWGTETLEYHARLLLRERADMLHFNMLNKHDNGSDEIYAWARPLAERSEGARTFALYVDQHLRAHNVYTKLLSRELCLKSLDFTKACGVRRYMEDLALCSTFFFHSQKYIGSDRVGYARRVRDTHTLKAPGRIVALAAMLREFIPYIMEQGCPLPVAQACSASLQGKLFRFTGEFYAKRKGQSPDERLRHAELFLPHADEVNTLKAVLAGHPYMRRILLERRKTPLWKTLLRRCRSKVSRLLSPFTARIGQPSAGKKQ